MAKLYFKKEMCKHSFHFQILLSFFAFICHGCTGQETSLFTNIAQEIGLNYVYDGVTTDGSGINFMDHNGDGTDDISFGTSTGQIPKFYCQIGDSLIPSFLYGFEFEIEGSRALNWIDYDNDGDKDLSITNVHSQLGFPIQGVQKLYNRINDSTLIDVTYEAGWSLEPFPSYCSAWADYNNDGWLDCYLSQRQGLNTSTNFLYKNNGDGTFEEVASMLGVDDTQGMTYQAVFFDYDLDGDVDLFTANDKWETHNSFFENNGDGTFSDISDEIGLMTYMEGMGVSIGDFDNNGYLDLVVTNATTADETLDSGNKLFLNSGAGSFTNVALELGVEGNNTVWGVNLFDVDNDMDLDLFFVSSGGSPQVSQKLFLNNNGEMLLNSDSSFLSTSGPSFGTAIGDFNNDGLYDIAVANNNFGKHQLWQNNIQNDNHWIKFNLEGTVSNRDAIGTLVEIWTNGWKQIRYTTCGNSYGSQDSDTYIIGLGTNVIVDSLVIKWPSGSTNKVLDIPSEKKYHLVENTSIELIDCLPETNFVVQENNSSQFTFNVTPIDSNSDYSWNMGDGNTIEGTTVTHTYTDSGSYNVCLTVTNSCVAANECILLQVVCPEVQSEFEWSASNLQIEFTLSSTNAINYSWYLDGVSINLVNSSLQLAQPGQYNICLVASNECSSDTSCQVIVATCLIPISSFSYTIENLDILVINNSSENDNSQWTLNGIEISTAESPTIHVTIEGQYELCLFSYNSCSVDSSCQIISVVCPAPIASFVPIITNMNVILENQSSTFDSLNWNLGNGIELQGELQEYTYNNPGEYTICLFAYNECGADSICENIIAVDPPLNLSTSNQNKTEFYPIPTGDFLFVQIPSIGISDLEFHIYTLNGVELEKSRIPYVIFNQLLKIDVKSLDQGFYLLEIISRNQHFSTSFIKE